MTRIPDERLPGERLPDEQLPDVRGMIYADALEVLAAKGILAIGCVLTKPPRQEAPGSLERCRVLRISQRGDGQVSVLICAPSSEPAEMPVAVAESSPAGLS